MIKRDIESEGEREREREREREIEVKTQNKDICEKEKVLNLVFTASWIKQGYCISSGYVNTSPFNAC